MRLKKSNYIEAYSSGSLKKIADNLLNSLKSCAICPRRCQVNRLEGERGYCRTGILPKMYSYLSHHGEEPPVSGVKGSGVIFFSSCNMSCAYCQNYQFSQLDRGNEITFRQLANIMLGLQKLGCHNINFVTPTHVLPQILQGLLIAIPEGLKIPLVYNTNGYELPQIIKLLDGIIDVYLPDMRYADKDASVKYSDAADYPLYNQKAVKIMHEQVGIAKFDKKGFISRGLIIRHLVLPQGLSGTEKIMRFIAKEIGPDTYISLMSQYYPYHKALRDPGIARRITLEEYTAAREMMHNAGLGNGWTQDDNGLESLAGAHVEEKYEA
ncbi:MAG: 4Fe-4S cluster-binding domain-containing protein [Candidatus Omnitrophica bacterium]|jgi:putative pyruvate formate lyase activating enzyme|nr:4Fe-4S cluster-binding domain-containing protein [Candidatus Omnitrophota bacterium]